MSKKKRTPLPTVSETPQPTPTPAPAKVETPTSTKVETPRRGFLAVVATFFGALAALLVAVPFVGYLLGALRPKKTNAWTALGPVGDFPLNETRLATFANPVHQPWDGQASQTAVYVRNQGKDDKGEPAFLVFAVNCTHLGCPVTWFPQSGLFMCPCHGGVYYENGDRASGPPPRGLYHCPWRVRQGKLEVEVTHLPTLNHLLDPGEKKKS